jgi:hypothetical protein
MLRRTYFRASTKSAMSMFITNLLIFGRFPMKTVFTLGCLSHIKKAPKHFIFFNSLKSLKPKESGGFNF